MFNYVFLVGTIIVKKVENKEIILTLSTWYDKDTQEKISVKASNALADFIKDNIKVGQKIAIKGRLISGKDVPVIAEKIITLGGKENDYNQN